MAGGAAALADGRKSGMNGENLPPESKQIHVRKTDANLYSTTVIWIEALEDDGWENKVWRGWKRRKITRDLGGIDRVRFRDCKWDPKQQPQQTIRWAIHRFLRFWLSRTPAKPSRRLRIIAHYTEYCCLTITQEQQPLHPGVNILQP